MALCHISELFECQNVDLPKRNQNRIADPDQQVVKNAQGVQQSITCVIVNTGAQEVG